MSLSLPMVGTSPQSGNPKHRTSLIQTSVLLPINIRTFALKVRHFLQSHAEVSCAIIWYLHPSIEHAIDKLPRKKWNNAFFFGIGNLPRHGAGFGKPSCRQSSGQICIWSYGLRKTREILWKKSVLFLYITRVCRTFAHVNKRVYVMHGHFRCRFWWNRFLPNAFQEYVCRMKMAANMMGHKVCHTSCLQHFHYMTYIGCAGQIGILINYYQ